MRQQTLSTRRARVLGRVGGGRKANAVSEQGARPEAASFGYLETTRRLARRAPQRFEDCDWAGAQMDATERLELLHRAGHEGSDAPGMLMSAMQLELAGTRADAIRRVDCAHSLADGIAQVLEQLSLEGEWQDLAGCVQGTAAGIRRELDASAPGAPIQHIDWLPVMFYRFKRAAVLCQLRFRERCIPVAIALTNGEQGMRMDEVLVGDGAVATLFAGEDMGYFADPAPTAAIIAALRHMVPQIPTESLCRAVF